MASVAREHVEEIRRRKFFIGGEPHPLTDDLHQAIIKNLSAEFYAKDVQFLMELIQIYDRAPCSPLLHRRRSLIDWLLKETRPCALLSSCSSSSSWIFVSSLSEFLTYLIISTYNKESQRADLYLC